MSKAFERELDELKKKLKEMAEITQSMIYDVIDGLVRRDETAFKTMREREEKINRMEMQIDDMAWKMIALRQPMGMDLRFIITAIKVNPLLERVADEAINILGKAEYLLTVPLLKPLIDTPRMSEKAICALSSSIQSLYEGDMGLARQVCLDDKDIDQLRDQIYRELITYMQESPDNTIRALKLIFIAKSLERIGDIATDICEDAIYLHQGKDIRHHSEDDEEFKKHCKTKGKKISNAPPEDSKSSQDKKMA